MTADCTDQSTSPRVKADLGTDSGEWLPITTPLNLPEKPLVLRFRLVGCPPLDLVHSRIERAVRGVEAQVEQSGTETIVVRVPQPPPRLHFDFNDPGLGKKSPFEAYSIYTGEPPVLVAYDPVTGQEERIAEVPPEVERGLPSPDGRWLMLATYPLDVWNSGSQVWLVDLSTGRVQLSPLLTESILSGEQVYPGPSSFVGDRLVVPFTPWPETVVQVYHLADGRVDRYGSSIDHFGPPSPDGRTLPGLAFDYDTGELHVGFLDVATGKEVTYPGLIPANRAGEHRWAGRVLQLWLPDGRLAVNLRTGGATYAIEPVTGASEQIRDPAELHMRPDWHHGPGNWAYQIEGRLYRRVILRDPNGERSVLNGEGLPVGWTPEGRILLIRWANGHHFVR